MPAVAAIFLVLALTRLVLTTFDQGIDKVWIAIYCISGLAWVLGGVMALDYLGLWPNIGIHIFNGGN